MAKRAVSKMNQKQRNHHANQANKNKGTDDTNDANAKVHGNRGKSFDFTMSATDKPFIGMTIG
jgi:hypothetical protein